MSKATTLMLMAAGLTTMPLVAVDSPDAGNTPTAAAPAAAAVCHLQQLASELSPAALLPVDIDMALILPNIQSFGEMMSELPLQGVVLGLSKGSADCYTAARTCQILCSLPELVQATAGEWQEIALPPFRELIAQAAANITQESGEKAVAAARKLHLPTVYLIASPKPGDEENVKQALEAYTKMLSSVAQGQEGVESVSAKDLNGLKISGAVLAEQAIELDETDPGFLKDIKEELAKRSFYLLGGMKEGKAVVILCENPEDIHWAASPEQSALSGVANEPWTKDDLGEGSTPWAFLTLSPEATHALNNDAVDVYAGIMKQVGSLFQTMAEKDVPQAAVFRAAAAGMGTLASEFAVCGAPVTQPTTIAVWETPGHVHLTAKSDALGCTYKPGKLHLASAADCPHNILYLEDTGADLPSPPNFAALITASDDVLKGLTASLLPEKTSELSPHVATAADILPELKNALQSFGTINDSLANGAAVVVCSEEVSTGTDQKSLRPAFCLYAGVANRAKLEQGAAAFGSSISNIITRASKTMGMLDQWAIESKITGSASVFNLTCPCLPPGVSPNVTLNDSQVALGSSIALNEKVLQCATGNTDFAGCVFSINFSELAKVANSLAPAPCCCTAPVAPVADDDNCDDDDDDILIVDAPSCTSENMHDIINTIAEYAKSMKGSSTIENNVHTLHIDVTLQK